MGFCPEDTHYRLKFTDQKYAGLQVVCTSLTVNDFLDISTLAQQVEAASSAGQTASSDGIGTARTLINRFADALVEWNLVTKNGDPVPTTRDGVGTQQLDFVLVIIRAWMDAIASVPDPLSNGSSSGETSLGLQELMAVSSPNQSS